jgi:iron complex outermembrane receptor protein
LNNVDYFQSKIDPLFTTDLEVSYRVTKAVTLSAGANNLFNKYPDKINPGYIAAARATLNTEAVTQYPSFSPIGINGGYYYARANYAF